MEAIDVDKAEAVAGVLKSVGVRRDSYLDPRLYPPPDDPLEDQLAYSSLWSP
jgi:hypothetical protein